MKYIPDYNSQGVVVILFIFGLLFCVGVCLFFVFVFFVVFLGGGGGWVVGVGFFLRVVVVHRYRYFLIASFADIGYDKQLRANEMTKHFSRVSFNEHVEMS